VWTLRKGQHVASCHLYTHPIGAEVRAMVNDELWRTQAGRDAMALVDIALEWKRQFMEKGWD
jgi:hypothetical protein